MQTFIYFFTKQASLMRRLIVLSLPFQLVFLVLVTTFYDCSLIMKFQFLNEEKLDQDFEKEIDKFQARKWLRLQNFFSFAAT